MVSEAERNRTMRYWIWWNELVQGPFEVSELSSLSAFSEDLPVCMESRTDWVPASRVADLSPAIEALRSRSYLPPPPPNFKPNVPTPPPPPARPPRLIPLQGDFFSTPEEQPFLFEPPGENTSRFDFSPVPDEAPPAVSVLPLPVTAPIRFVALAPGQAGPGVIEVQPLEAQITFVPAEFPAKEEHPEPIIDFNPEPMRESIPEPETIHFPEPAVAQRPQPVRQSALPITESETLWKPKIAIDIFPPETPIRRSLWPWLAGCAALTGLFLMAGYWWLDYKTTTEAIKAVKPIPPIAKPPMVKAAPAVVPAPTPSIKPVLQTKPKSKPAPKPAPKAPKKVAPPSLPVAAVIPVAKLEKIPQSDPVPESRTVTKVDPWKDRQSDAIQGVMKFRIAGGKLSIADHAKAMLEQMHDKELLHAAQTGERLFLPDKMGWSALREEGPLYRVYLNYSALQADGQRVQTRSYQFSFNLEKNTLVTDDSATRQDFLTMTQPVRHVRVEMAKEIDNLLSGVDALNKQKLRAMISRNGRNKKEAKAIETAVQAARDKVRKSIVYFRTKHPEKVIQNIAKAYVFTELLK